jgi:branched-chain amino acid aminotransferase
MKVYLDGEFMDEKRALVSVFDRSFLYGDGIFETMRSYGGAIFREEKHIERLKRSASAIGIRLPEIDWSRILKELLKENSLCDALIRITVSAGKGWGVSRESAQPTVVIFARWFSGHPEAWYEDGIEAVIVKQRRFPREIKSANYLDSIIAKREAGDREGIMLTFDGEVACGTASNIFIVEKGKLVTPPTDLGILPGITRETVIEIAKGLGLLVKEDAFPKERLFLADEVFLTSTSFEIMPVVTVDSRPIGDGRVGRITENLLSAYREQICVEKI